VTELARARREHGTAVGARTTSASEEDTVTELARARREHGTAVGARTTSASEEDE
jgi:hypothetical protein